MSADRTTTGRWRARPHRASALRAAVFVGPILASLTVCWLVTRMLPPSDGWGDQAAHLVVLLLVSTGVLLVVDRVARRLLPLAALLELTLLFPSAAPSRLTVARDAIRRRPIEVQLARVREAGADPGMAATEILALVAAMSRHDRPTRGHAERVRMFTDLIAEQMRVPERDRDLLRWAAILHDIGKLRISSTLLNKPGKPEPYEWLALRAHPTYGAEIAAGLLPWLGEWGRVIPEHHERWDGTGYPRGLSGQDIHVGARIVAVADAYDVMTSARAYRRPVSRAAAYQELIRFAGTQFDPTAVRAMVAVSAPQLRRTQGALAWLVNLPLVTSHVVPATSLARLVGAGAVASTAVAGVGLPTVPAAGPEAVVSVVADEPSVDAIPPPTKAAPPEKEKAAKVKPKETTAPKKKKVKPARTAEPVVEQDPAPKAGKGKTRQQTSKTQVAEAPVEVVEELPVITETAGDDGGADSTLEVTVDGD